LRPLERRFRVDVNSRKTLGFMRANSGAEAAAVQTLRDQRTLSSQFDFENTA
jgi:hypothetical protein